MAADGLNWVYLVQKTVSPDKAVQRRQFGLGVISPVVDAFDVLVESAAGLNAVAGQQSLVLHKLRQRVRPRLGQTDEIVDSLIVFVIIVFSVDGRVLVRAIAVFVFAAIPFRACATGYW